MTNPARGELEITLGDRVLKARVSLDLVMRVETNLNSSIIQLAQKLSEGGLRVSDMLVILTPALKAGGEVTDEKEIKNILGEAGTVDAIKACADILAKAINPKGDEGNEQEADQE